MASRTCLKTALRLCRLEVIVALAELCVCDGGHWLGVMKNLGVDLSGESRFLLLRRRLADNRNRGMRRQHRGPLLKKREKLPHAGDRLAFHFSF